MRTYKSLDSALDLRRLSSFIRSEGDEVKADSDPKKLAVRSTEKLSDIASGCTLDDFGGRSDALGG